MILSREAMVCYDIHTHYPPARPEDVAIINRIIGDGENPPPMRGSYRSVGIHPWYISHAEEQLAELRRQALSPDVVAIGETGLDKLAETPLKCQQEIFSASVSLAEELGLFVIIHCVKAWDELIALKKACHPRMPWVIHGFRGKAALARQLIRQGFYLSFGARFNPDALHEAWPNRLFAETDDCTTGIRSVYDSLSASLDIPLQQFAGQIAENVRSLPAFSSRLDTHADHP